MANPQGINQYTKGRSAKKKAVSQAQVNITKGNHRPGWMLRADPALAKKVKAARSGRKYK